jgi:hypothetical protein
MVTENITKSLQAENTILKKELRIAKNQRDIYLKELQRRINHEQYEGRQNAPNINNVH